MAVDDTLARVASDVATGHLALARQRLRGLVATYPDRLDLRAQLAGLYRVEGNAAQAGRWSYLSSEPDSTELSAFERAYPDLRLRMKALGWRGPEEAAGPVGAQRLQKLREATQARHNRESSWEDPNGTDPKSVASHVASGAGCTAGTLIFLLILIGTGALAWHGLQVVLGWLD